MNFHDKVFIITGSSQGIGKEIGCQLLAKGAKIVFNGRRKKDEIKEPDIFEHANSLYLQGDVSLKKDCELIVEKTLDVFGKIDGLILSAGVSAAGDFKDLNESVVRQMVSVNIFGITWITQLILPHLIKSKGSVLFISSLASIYGVPYYSLYSAVKMSMNGLAQSIRNEVKDNGVFVGLALAGFTENTSQKRILNADGTPEPVPKRNGFKVQTRKVLAQKLITQIEKRRELFVNTSMGKFGYLVNKWFPTIYKFTLLNNFRKTQKLN